MHHIIEHINQDIKWRKSSDKDPTVNKSGYQSKEFQQVNPRVPDNEALYISNLMQRANLYYITILIKWEHILF